MEQIITPNKSIISQKNRLLLDWPFQSCFIPLVDGTWECTISKFINLRGTCGGSRKSVEFIWFLSIIWHYDIGIPRSRFLKNIAFNLKDRWHIMKYLLYSLRLINLVTLLRVTRAPHGRNHHFCLTLLLSTCFIYPPRTKANVFSLNSIEVRQVKC